MAKKDLTLPKNAHVEGSRSQKSIEHEKAIQVLENAKKLKRKVVFVKQGEGEFTRKKSNYEHLPRKTIPNRVKRNI